DRMEAISDRTSSLYFELYHKLKMAEQDYKLKKELSEFQYLSEASRLRIKVYQNIDVAADAIARSLKLDLVLRVGEPPLEVERETTTLQRLSQQVVLYHDAKLDITPQVLAKLNEEYRKGKEQKPPEKKP
ncbi:MAG: hypothetical protein HY716_00645, partial [Planctomycetes bacterium]|nr:hypothetical protein [Planctomycetota bacterium]